MEQARIIFSLLLLLGVSSQKNKDYDSDEGRPYEFSFTIDGEQHRYEKKDVNGIIQGEFGFITGDGVYHVTVYATDENGSFKILSMRNVKISEPLDKGGKPSTIGKFGPTAGKQPVDPARPVPSPIAPKPHVPAFPAGPPPGPTTRSPLYDFTTASTIRNGCSGCGIVTKPPPGAALPFQNPAFKNNGNGGPKGLISVALSPAAQPSAVNPSFPTSPAPLPQGPGPVSGPPQSPQVELSAPGLSPGPPGTDTSLEPNPFGPQQPFNPQPGPPVVLPGVSPPGVALPVPGSPGIIPISGSPQVSIPGPAGIPPISGSRPVGLPQQPQIQSPAGSTPPRGGFDNRIPSRPDPVSPKVKVKDGVIEIPGNTVKIADKYPNMVDGLPDGINEGDIKDLLYKFNYTVGFHGHYEKGLKNGAKIGGYFVNGRDGFSRVVTYVADENGYKPKFKLINLGLDSEDTPKPDSEKKFGLKSFEFIWYPAK